MLTHPKIIQSRGTVRDPRPTFLFNVTITFPNGTTFEYRDVQAASASEAQAKIRTSLFISAKRSR